MRWIQRGRADGIISIVVTMILMLVISLMVLGFAQISRREQRASLDRQLSTQAFLAAESGVNDARAVVLGKMANGQDVPEKTSCGTDINYTAGMSINTAANVSYTCLLISTKMTTLSINPLSAGSAAQTLMLESDGGAVRDLTVTWKSLQTIANQGRVNGDCKLNGGDTLPAAADWKCPYGLLRADIVPADTFNRAAMTANTKTLLVYPVGSSGNATVAYAASNGAIVPTACDTTKCTLTVTGLSGASRYALRLQSVYADGAVDISATAAGGAALELKNAQIQIDATGKAQDVLRRIQVRLPYTTTNNAPDYALQSGSSICKRFAITTDSFVIPNDIVGQDTNNPMCKTMSVAPPQVQPPGTTVCTKRGPNLVANGSFSRNVGAAFNVARVDPAVWGFSTKLPNRGENIFPDDLGQNGTNSDTSGWGGGFSRWTVNGTAQPNGIAVLLREFAGDTTANWSVPGSKTMMYTNPFQTTDQPKVSTRPIKNGNPDTMGMPYFVGSLWEQTLSGLAPDTTYDFTGYFANVLTPAYASAYPDHVDPTIELSVDDTILLPKTRIEIDNSQWHRITLTFTTKPGQTSATFKVKDYAGYTNGDDFAMTALGVYRCLD